MEEAIRLTIEIIKGIDAQINTQALFELVKKSFGRCLLTKRPN